MQGSVSTTIPIKMGVYVDLQDSTIGDEAAVKQMTDFLQKYYDSGSDKDFKFFDVDVKPDPEYDGYVSITFEGDLDVEGTYSTTDSYVKYNSTLELDDVCDPDITEDDFLASVRKAVAEGPLISFEFENGNTTNTKDAQFLKNAIDFDDDCDYPSDSEIGEVLYAELDNIVAGAIDDAYDRWRDRDFESLMKNVLDGKTLNEVLTERADWDIQPEETVSSSEVAQMEYQEAVNDWKNELGETIEAFAKLSQKLSGLIKKGRSEFGIEPKGRFDVSSFLVKTAEWAHFISTMLEG